MNRAILACGLALLVGIPAIAIVYWSDRQVSSAPPMAEQAVAAAEAAVKANPQDLAARDRLAAAYISAKRLPDGIEQFSQVLKIDAKDRAALLGRGIAYVTTGQLDAAAADFQKFIADNGGADLAKTDPQLEHAYYELGIVQLQKGQATEAVATLQKALTIDGGDADALYSLGAALVKTGEDAKAVNALKLATAFVPTGWCEPYQELAKAYTALASTDGAAWATAMVAACEGRTAEAKAALAPLTTGTMKVDALVGLGYVVAQDGDNVTAADYFRQALRADPGNRSAAIALGAIGEAAAPGAATSAAPTASN